MIALVRHGAYSLRNGSLTDEGRLQAKHAAEELEKYSGWISVVSSPAKRTHEAAEIIADILRIPLNLDDLWGETRSPEYCRESIKDKTIYVTHQPILKFLAPEWDAPIGGVSIVEASH